MPKLLNVEEEEKGLPILCLFGEYTRLLEIFIKENKDKFRIILISSKKPENLGESPSIYFLTYQESEIILKLEERIDYALIYLSKKDSKEFLSPIISKLKKDRAKILFLFYSFSFDSFYDVLLSYKNEANTRFAIIGELLSRKSVEQEGELSNILDKALTKHEITFGGNDLYPVYPISLKDAMTGISRLLLGSFKGNILYYLFYPHPESVLATAHLIGRVEPDIKIVFTESNNQKRGLTREEIESIAKTKLQMREEYASFDEGFEKGIENLFQSSEEEIVGEGINDILPVRNGGKKKNILISTLKFSFISLFFGTFLFIFLNLLFLGIGLLFLKGAIDDIKSDNISKISRNADIAKTFLGVIKPTAYISLGAISLVDAKGQIQETLSLVERAAELASITGSTFNEVTSANGKFTEKTLMSTLSNVSYLFQEGQRITIEQNNNVLSTLLKSDYSKLLSLTSILPQVLGYDTEKNYLLLFQNDNELRPTGGFIGSIGELTVKKGQIENLTVQDVYTLDGQLKNHVEPPFIVRRYLQPHLYLRDSNFSLNFQETASKSAFIYNLETGKKPDAVVAINLDVLEKIMKISGSVVLPNYNTTVTSENVSDFLEGTIKENNFPGSTQKKDVLNALLNQLVLRFSSNPKDYVAILRLLPNLLEEKSILIAFSDNDIQKVFSANNYAGEGIDQRTIDKKMIQDYLEVNEANIGVNKANSKISREVSYETQVGENVLDSKVTLTLTNNNTTDDYKAYLEYAVPQGSQIETITIDGVKQTLTNAITDPKIYEEKNFKAPVGLEVEQYIHNEHTIFAFITSVKQNTKSTIIVTYHNAAGHALSTIADYSLLYIKQPGTKPYKLSTTLNYPDTYSPTDTHADSYGKNYLQEENVITKDFTTSIELKKRSVEN